jgi:hypothetical protein
MRRRVLALLVILSPALASAQAEPPWHTLSDKEGMLIEGRPMPGTALREVRLRTRSPLPAEEIFATIWNVSDQASYVPNIKWLHVLAQGPEQVVIHERVHIPVAQDRDYVLRLTRKIDRVTGRYQVFAEGRSELGPPPEKGVVRMTRLWSTYTLVARPDGGSDVEYLSFGDPTGSLPAWIIRAADQRGPREFVRAILEHTRQRLRR